MKAIIHKGKAGKSYARLCKEYETRDFYEVIVESVMNGHREQAVEQFNLLGGPWQYAFMAGGFEDYGYYGKETFNLILKALWSK